MRFLSIFLPTLATDRITRQITRQQGLGPCRGERGKSPEAPLASVAKIKGAQRLAALNARAKALGLRSGMSLPDARAMYPSLVWFEADEKAETETLENIVDWCRRFTPLAASDPPDGAMLDVSGAAHLFGGETKLIAEIEAGLEAQGFGARAAAAPTPEAAWALARYGSLRLLPSDLDEKEIARRLEELPLAALRLDAATLADLAQAGLRRIGDVMMRPRAPIAARCGGFLYKRLDGLLGRLKTPISPRFEAPAYLAERRFLDGVTRREDIEASILSLARDLSELLARHGEGARRLRVSLFRVDGVVQHIETGASRPLRDAELVARLFHERIEAAGADDDPFDPGYGFDVIRLAALETERQDPEQTGWSEAESAADLADLGNLIDRLSARLGARRVVRLDFQATHTPEAAVRARPAAHGREGAVLSAPCILPGGLGPPSPDQDGAASPPALPARPLRLLRPPEPIEAIACAPDGPPLRFRWRRVLHEIAAFEGPERIAPEWWRSETSLTRDYFRAEDVEGQRFWLFREGLFHRETVRPRWFMHGLFA